ncbi:hypothetical protein BD769DRAFT_1498920 [Suillus cothurnatus]|nr:hypothetical protein BD769DRAFT_1498920 [Suillus cothurnatus]
MTDRHSKSNDVPAAILAQSEIWDEEKHSVLQKPTYKKKDLDAHHSKACLLHPFARMIISHCCSYNTRSNRLTMLVTSTAGHLLFPSLAFSISDVGICNISVRPIYILTNH